MGGGGDNLIFVPPNLKIGGDVGRVPPIPPRIDTLASCSYACVEVSQFLTTQFSTTCLKDNKFKIHWQSGTRAQNFLYLKFIVFLPCSFLLMITMIVLESIDITYYTNCP